MKKDIEMYVPAYCYEDKEAALKTKSSNSKYTIYDDVIIFHLPHREYSFPIEIVDKWFQLYTTEDMTIDSMAQHFGLPKSDMSSMMKAVNLTKKSPSRAPWVIASAVDFDQLTEDTLSLMVASFEAKKNSKITEEYKRLSSEENEHKKRVELIKAYSAENQPEVLPFEISVDDAAAMVIICTDWHIGFKGANFNLTIAKDRITRYAHKIIDFIQIWAPSSLNLYFLGDIIDSPSGDMYPNQKREQDVFDHEQVVEAANIMVSFITLISKFHEDIVCHMVSGNHGKTYENIVYEWVKSACSNLAEFNIVEREDIVVCDNSIPGWTVLAHHGEKLNSPEKIKNIIDDEPIRNKQIFIQGHEHHFEVSEFGRHKMKVKSGSIVGGNYYAKSNGWNSCPSQTIIVINEDGAMPIYVGLD